MIWAYVGAGVAAIALGFGSGWQVRAWKCSADQASAQEQQVRDDARRTEHTDTAAVVYETKRAAGQAKTRIVIKEVERVIQADPVYRDRCLTDDGLRAVASAIAGTDAASGPAPALPASAAAR